MARHPLSPIVRPQMTDRSNTGHRPRCPAGMTRGLTWLACVALFVPASRVPAQDNAACWPTSAIRATTMEMSDGANESFTATRLRKCTFRVTYRFTGGGGSGYTEQDFLAVYRKGDLT